MKTQHLFQANRLKSTSLCDREVVTAPNTLPRLEPWVVTNFYADRQGESRGLTSIPHKDFSPFLNNPGDSIDLSEIT